MTSSTIIIGFLLIRLLNGVNSLKDFAFRPGLTYTLGITPFRKIPNIPIGECRNECISRTRCQSLGYRRHIGLCLLYDQDSSSTGTVQDPAVTYSEKKHWLETPLSQSCKDACQHTDVCRVQGGTASCSIEDCTSPGEFGEDSIIYGNIRTIGSAILYVCNGYDFRAGKSPPFVVRSKCAQGGDWLREQPDAECYHNVSSIIEYSGCYLDQSERTLTGDYLQSDSMTVQMCAEYCLEKQFTIFGLEFHKECYCGSTMNNQELSNNCYAPCEGNTNERCGGPWALDIYTYTINNVT